VGVPWAPIMAVRNRLIHGYFDVDTEIVLAAATVEVPRTARASETRSLPVLSFPNAARAVARRCRLRSPVEDLDYRQAFTFHLIRPTSEWQTQSCQPSLL
jgi:hypothetical protein